MPWTQRCLRALCSFIGSSAFYLGCATIALAASRQIENDWSAAQFWYLFAAVQLCWAVGYCMSSLPKWGRWVDGGADTEYKLTIIVGIIFALVAGNLAYYLTYYEANLKHLYCFITALAGGFAGEKWLAPLLMRTLPAWSTTPQDKGG